MLVASFVQIFLFCFCGDLIKSSANSCSIAIYASKWYQLKSTEDKQTILLMLLNSQRHVGFSVGGFTLVSMELFAQVNFWEIKTLKT